MLGTAARSHQTSSSTGYKYPVEDDVTDEELAALLELDVAEHPGCYALLLCWHSRDRVCASLSSEARWRLSPLEITAHKHYPMRKSCAPVGQREPLLVAD